MEFKAGPADFTRQGLLSPLVLVALILRMVSQGDRRGYAHLLDEFWEDAEDQGIDLGRARPVSAAAFCKARHKLKPEVFRHLLRDASQVFDEQRPQSTLWKGRRVLAVDGTTTTVRRSDKLWAAFGAAEGSYYPQAAVVTLYDALGKMPRDVWIGPYASSERTALMALTESLEPGDVVVLDRGYPSYKVIAHLLERKVDFVIRMPGTNTIPEVERFVEDGFVDMPVFLPLPSTAVTNDWGRARLRMVRCARKDGTEIYLLTTLGTEEATRADLDHLYHARWAIEECFKLPKGLYLHQRQCHAKSVQGVHQEILALFLLIALAQSMRSIAAEELDQEPQELSQKAALLATSRHLACLVLATPSSACRSRSVLRVVRRIQNRRDPPRPDRVYPRRSFQPRPRWGAHGKLGKVG